MHYILWIVLSVFILVVFLAAVFCVRTARQVLSPRFARQPLRLWPDQYKLTYENIYFSSEDGVLLRGWFLPFEGSEKTVVCMHGWGMNRSDVFKHTCFLHDLGYNLMYFDFRSQGESGGEVSSAGWLEAKDLQAALRWLKENRPFASARVGLYGLDVGAAAALYEAAHNPDIQCVAAEAAYYSLRRLAERWLWMRRHIPSFPLVPIVLHYIRRSLPQDPEHYAPKYTVEQLTGRPLFFIHGRYDNLIPAAQAKMLFKRAHMPKDLWLVPGAKHGKCADVGGFEYKQRLSDFFRNYL